MYVGVILESSYTTNAVVGIPHVRGGDPSDSGKAVVAAKSIPHVRGGDPS